MRWAVFVALLVFGLSGDARAGDRGDATAAPLVLAQSSLAVIDGVRVSHGSDVCGLVR